MWEATSWKESCRREYGSFRDWVSKTKEKDCVGLSAILAHCTSDFFLFSLSPACRDIDDWKEPICGQCVVPLVDQLAAIGPRFQFVQRNHSDRDWAVVQSRVSLHGKKPNPRSGTNRSWILDKVVYVCAKERESERAYGLFVFQTNSLILFSCVHSVFAVPSKHSLWLATIRVGSCTKARRAVSGRQFVLWSHSQ